MINCDAHITFNNNWFIKKLRKETKNATSIDPRIIPGIHKSSVDTNADEKILKKFLGESTLQYDIVSEVYFHNLELMLPLIPVSEHKYMREAYRQMIYFEWLSQVELTKKRYRDHITHPAKVTILGLWFLFDNNINAFKTILSILKNNTKEYRLKHNIIIPDWDHFLKQIWLITGIFHDFCYPVEFLLKLCYNISKSFPIWSIFQSKQFRLCSIFQNKQDSLENILKKLNNSFFLLNIDNNSNHAKQKISQIINRGNTNQNHIHAALGALNLLKLYTENSPLHTKDGLMFQLAASAIFGHHEGNPVIFNDHPIDFLLVLCDTLQEWGRSFLKKQPPEDNKYIIEEFVECEAVESTLKHVTNSINFKFRTPSSIIRSKTGWDEKKFIEGKEKDVKLFTNHGSFPKINFGI